MLIDKTKHYHSISITMQRASASAPAIPPKKKLRFAAKQVEYKCPESSESDDDDILCTPTGQSSNPLIRNELSPPDSSVCALPFDAINSSKYLRGRQNEFKPSSPFSNDEVPIVHPALDTGACFIWDMATDPGDLKFLPIEGDDPAAKTQTTHLPIMSVVLKLNGIYEWPIMVEARQGVYPTVSDAFNAIYINVTKHAAKQDVEVLHEQTRRRLYEAREARCCYFQLDPALEPLRRVDFLLGSRRFLGITPSPGSDKFILNVGILPSQS